MRKTTVVTGAVIVAGALVMWPGLAAAGERRVVVEGHVGSASFVDNAPIRHDVFGGSARVYVTPRLALGPEVTFMRGPGIDRDWVFTGNATLDLVDASSGHRALVPYLIGGGGFTRMTTEVGTGPYTSGEGALTAGGGLRITPTGRWFIAPEFRLGWELHWRAGITLGFGV